MPIQQDLYDFMLGKLGGEEEVKKELCERRVADLGELTLADARAKAKDDGWLDILDGYTLIEIANLINPPEEGKPRTAKKRLTAAEVEALQAKILEFVAANKDCKARDIAKAVGVKGPRLGAQLKKLRDTGKLKTHGERANTTYSTPVKATKPVRRKKKS